MSGIVLLVCHAVLCCDKDACMHACDDAILQSPPYCGALPLRCPSPPLRLRILTELHCFQCDPLACGKDLVRMLFLWG